MAEVVLSHVSKRFDQTAVLADLNLSVRDREFLVLVGPSGCGKSTVLRLIAGLESVSEGEVRIADRRVNEVHPKDRDIAMVFQNYALYPHMNVYDNMAFGLKMRKTPKDEIRIRVAQAAKILDLAHLLTRKPGQLSGGQRQRVALGRAIVRNPKVFLMDEPLSNLDAKLRVSMRSEIAQLHQRLSATTIYVTHDQVEAMTMGDRLVILNEGRIQQIDTPSVVYNCPANLFVAEFIGQMNVLEGTLSEQGFIVDPDVVLALSPEQHRMLSEKAGTLTLGIRPEHFYRVNDAAASAITVNPARIELLGSEQWIHFMLAGKSFVAKLPPDETVHPNEPLRLGIDLNRASWFDAVSGNRLG